MGIFKKKYRPDTETQINGARLVTFVEPKHVILEQFRTLRTNIEFAGAALDKLQVVMFTSAEMSDERWYMEFSVLMAVYSGDDFGRFKKAFESILNQTLPPSQIVVVKDGPISSMIEEYLGSINVGCTQLEVVALPKNSGLATALNVGLKHTKYPVVARVDSDDFNLKNRFELQVSEFIADERLTVLSGTVSEKHQGDSITYRRLPSRDGEIRKFLKLRSPFNHPAVMFKKEAVLSVGGYNTDSKVEDYDLWFRLSKNKDVVFKNLSDVLVDVDVEDGMYDRRGGWKYLRSYAELKNNMRKEKVISFAEFILSVFGVAVSSHMPSWMRKSLYITVLRKKE